MSSDNRIDRIVCWPVWPDLAKFRHFGKPLKVLVYSLAVDFVLGKT